jgi:hypothetical protein
LSPPYCACKITENKCGGEEQTTKRHQETEKAQNKRLAR